MSEGEVVVAELKALSDGSDVFRLADLRQMVAGYAQTHWLPLSPLLEEAFKWGLPALTAAMMQSQTWGELCSCVPIGSIGILSLKHAAVKLKVEKQVRFEQRNVVFIVTGKPASPSSGLINVAFLSLQGLPPLQGLRRKTLEQILLAARTSKDISFYDEAKQLNRSHDMWGNPQMPVSYLPPHPMGEQLKSVSVGQKGQLWIRFIDLVDATDMYKYMGGFYGFLSRYAALDAFLWKTSILAELDQQHNSRPPTNK